MRGVRCRMWCLVNGISRGGRRYWGYIASTLRCRWRTAIRWIRLRRSRRCACRLTALGVSIAARGGSAKWWRCRGRTILRYARTWTWLANIIGLWTRVLLRSRLRGLSRASCRRWWVILRWNIICVCLRGRRGITSGLSSGVCVLRWRLGRRLLIIWLWTRTTILSWLLLLTT